MKTILIVEPDLVLSEFMESILSSEDYHVEYSTDTSNAIDRCRKEHFDVVVTVLKTPEVDGMGLLKSVKTYSPDTAVILITANGSRETEEAAMREGADYYMVTANLPFLKHIVREVLNDNSRECSSQGPLRDQICVILKSCEVSHMNALNVLSQCESQIRNRKIVEKIAKECGFELAGFITNDELELYYDIKCRRKEMGYISKGWEDPGFRIGDLIRTEKEKANVFKNRSSEIHKFCVFNGIGMTFSEKGDDIEIQMDDVIYIEGFNKDTFMKTLETINECVDKIQEMI